MDIHNKTNEEFQQELLELRQEINFLKELFDMENSMRKLSYDEMHENSHKLTLAMQGGNMAWWEMDVPTGNVTFDKHKVEMLGYPPENFKHYTDFTALVHPKDYKRIMNKMKGHLDGSFSKYEAEYRIMASSGEYIWFYDYGSVVKNDPNGKPLIVTGFVYNISERKNAEIMLLKIIKAIDSTSDAIAISDSQGHHFYQNKALSDLFEYPTTEEVEAAGGGMARVKDPAVAKQLFKNILHGKSWSGELEMVTKSGRVFPAYERADAIKDNEGNIIGIIGIITDITERKQDEDKLQKSENMLLTILDNFPGVIFWKDRQSIYLGCNQSFATGAGLKSPAEIVGKTDLEMPWASTEAINYLKDDMDVMENGKGKLHIIETQHQSDGQVIFLDTSKLALRDSNGKVIGVIGVSNDISNLMMAVEELTSSDKELAFQNIEKEKREEELNIINIELTAQNIEIEGYSAKLIIANNELAFQNEEKENRAAELAIANKELVFQITEHSKVEVALKESEERYRTIFENSTIGIYRTTPDGQILLVNPTLIKLLGYNSLDDLAEINLNEKGFETTYERTFFMDAMKKDGEVKGFESAWIKMNGTTLFVCESARSINDKEGKILYYDGIVEDITLRKQAEGMLTHSNEQLSKFATNLQLVREEERLNLAREIHDSLAQFLVALKIDMGIYKKKISNANEDVNSEEVIAEIEQLMIQVDNANKSARSIMNGLRPEQLEVLGFVESAEVHLRNFEQTHHIKCSFKNTVLDLNIHPDLALALFRILQESLNNILKHAMATMVTVQLTTVAGNLVLKIIDNGTGFDVNHKGRPDSYGLIGMKERIKLLGGNLDITSKVGEGTMVNVEIHYAA
jgi:PAS domain S-box-containing protein